MNQKGWYGSATMDSGYFYCPYVPMNIDPRFFSEVLPPGKAAMELKKMMSLIHKEQAAVAPAVELGDLPDWLKGD